MAKELNQSYRTAYQEKDEAKMKELQEQYENLMKDYSIYNFSFSFNSIAYKPFFLQVNTNSIFLVEVLF